MADGCHEGDWWPWEAASDEDRGNETFSIIYYVFKFMCVAVVAHVHEERK